VEAVVPRVLGVTTAHPRLFEAPRGARATKDRQPRIHRCLPNFQGSRHEYAIRYRQGGFSRLEMDSRWALARSVRALVAERDALKESSVPGTEVAPKSRDRPGVGPTDRVDPSGPLRLP
jgi:hypothetical protein